MRTDGTLWRFTMLVYCNANRKKHECNDPLGERRGEMARTLCRGCGVFGGGFYYITAAAKSQRKHSVIFRRDCAGGMNNLMRAAIEITGVKKP